MQAIQALVPDKSCASLEAKCIVSSNNKSLSYYVQLNSSVSQDKTDVQGTAAEKPERQRARKEEWQYKERSEAHQKLA